MFYSIIRLVTYYVPSVQNKAVKMESKETMGTFDTYAEAEKHIAFLPPGIYQIEKYFIH